MARLAANVVLRDPTGSLAVLSAGSDLPEWAEGLVGEHVLEGDVRSEPAEPAPDGSWTVADLREYATEHGIDLGGATKKADILAAVTGD